MEILSALKDSPVPTILVVAGIFFLTLAIATQLGWKIKVSSQQQKVSVVIGALLLFFGISLYLFPTLADSFGAKSPPVILGVTIRESHEEGELVIYQEINFYDDDGNTNRVEWDLIDLSDPSQSPYIQTQNEVINDLPEIQKIRSTATRAWYCEGRVYNATLEVSLSDSDGNRSKPVRYTIKCN
jgi:hypothetical protein